MLTLHFSTHKVTTSDRNLRETVQLLTRTSGNLPQHISQQFRLIIYVIVKSSHNYTRLYMFVKYEHSSPRSAVIPNLGSHLEWENMQNVNPPF